MVTAYSYVRFSTEKQELGASLARQVEHAKQYAQQHNLILNSQTYQDLGVSAFKGLNATEGALSRFLKACDEGRIEKGSFLLVESLDRLSRNDVQTALILFQRIVGKSITIVTLSDGQKYSTESINENWTQLIIALSVMSRANEESKTKSKRIQDGWDKKKKKAMGGSVILTAKGPSWLKLDNGKWLLVKEKVKAVKKVYELAFAGNGSPKIAKLMNEKYKIPPLATAKFWTQSTVGSVLASPSVMGTFQRRDHPDQIIKNYYPKIIEPEFFYAVREKVVSRRRKSGVRGEVVNNLFSGLLHCSCGSKMRSVNSNKHKYYIRCLKSYANAGCDSPIVSYERLEKAILGTLIGVLQMPLDDSAKIPHDPSIAIREEIDDKGRALSKLVQALELGDEIRKPTAIVNRIGRLEDEISVLEKELKNVVIKPSIKGVIERTLEVFFQYSMLQKDGNTEELRDLRLKMTSIIQTQLTKIVMRNDVGEFEQPSLLGNGELMTWAEYNLYGPIIDLFRTANISKENIYFTDDGGWRNIYPLHMGPRKKREVNRRNIKTKQKA